MIMFILLGWAVALPFLVVVGLYAASKLLRIRGRRHAGLDATGLAHEFARIADLTSPTLEDVSSTPRRPAGVGH